MANMRSRSGGSVPQPAATEYVTTSMRIEVETLAALKILAAERRCKVNDLVVDAIASLLSGAKA